MSDPVQIRRGTIELELHEEFPGLELVYATVRWGDAKTPRAVKQRLLGVSDRFRVAHAPALRQGKVPSAYRAFYRQVGLDPDAHRTPLDEAIRERLLQGSFRPWGHLEDSITIAALETLVPIWALDGGGIVGGLGVRSAEEGEVLMDGAGVVPLAPGQLVLADANAPLTALLQPAPEGRRVTRQSTSTVLYCLQVPGVSTVSVEEALTLCAQVYGER